MKVSSELVRMYGGNTNNLSVKTKERTHQFLQSIMDNELEWCVEYQGHMIGVARLTVTEKDNHVRYAVGLFGPNM